MGQHVLVTGAGGFSGAHMVAMLLGRGHTVTAIIRSNRSTLPINGKTPRLSVAIGDLTSMKLPKSVDAIVHVAARSAWQGVTIDEMVRDNVFATARLVEYARCSGVRKFIFFSTLSVYGRITSPVVDESTPVLDPDAYGLTKRLGEEIIAAASESFSSLSIRLPGVVGQGSVRNWLTNVAAAAREGGEISIFNPEAMFNNAVHVTDLGVFVGGLLERDWRGADAVTLAAGGTISISEAVRLLVTALGGRARVIVKPAIRSSFVISFQRAAERYGYRPMDIKDLLYRFAAEIAN